jgi:hypothetical protein
VLLQCWNKQAEQRQAVVAQLDGLFGTQPVLRKWAARGKHFKQLRFKLQKSFVRDRTGCVERLAEEIPGGACQDHIQDFCISKSAAVQISNILCAYLVCPGGYLLRKRHHCNFFGRQMRVAEILGNGHQLPGAEEIFAENLSV